MIAIVAIAAPPAAAARGPKPVPLDGPVIAAMGDLPYGAESRQRFPTWMDRIAVTPGLGLMLHLGDIKAGDEPCTVEYNQGIRDVWEARRPPVVYTPGDNEWTDCHRVAAGAYDPLERLAELRSTFYSTPGESLGRKAIPLRSQAAAGYPENALWRARRITFGTVHAVGSLDGSLPWTGHSAETPEQREARLARAAAGSRMIRRAFAVARDRGDRAVVISMQADMFPRTRQGNLRVFTPYARTLGRQAARYPGKVYLLNGDRHYYTAGRPYADPAWRDFYGVPVAARKIQRIQVPGPPSNGWVHLRIRRDKRVLTWHVRYLT